MYMKTCIPALYPTIVIDAAEAMHISLTRPLFLRAHQREGFKRTIRGTCRGCFPFRASFARFAILNNDENTRTFLVLEVGAGHLELKALSDAVTPHVRALHQEPYYEAPRFHVSIAWALLHVGTQGTGRQSSGLANQSTFPSVSELPESLILDLERRYSSRIREKSEFEVNGVELKIGKYVTQCPFT